MRVRFWLYYGICCVGLIGVVRVHIRFIYAMLFQERKLQLYEYIARWPDKPIELFFFFLGAVFVLLYALLIYAVWTRLKESKAARFVWRQSSWTSADLVWVALLSWLNFTIGFGYWRQWFGMPGTLVGDLLWICAVSMPGLITLVVLKARKGLSGKLSETLAGMRKIYILFIVVAFLQFVSLVWPFVAKPLQMMGEYLAVSSQTLVNGQYVDNASYYSKHQLLGAHPRYQMERDEKSSPLPNPEACLSIGLNPGVEELISKTRNRSAYFYDKRLGLLCNTGPITPADWLLIRQAATDRETLLRAESWLVKDIEYGNSLQKRIYSEEEIGFLTDNQFALEFQLNGIWVLHHHNFVLGPINEYALGKPQRDIFPQYGWLNMVVTSHLMEWSGGITYDKYFKVWYSYYIIYFLLLIGLFCLIFRHTGYVALATVLSAGLMSCIPFVWYFQGPGLNPVRHFFDVFVIAGLYLYLEKDRPAFLFGALLFSILGILNNTQLGLACLGALVTAVGVVWFRRTVVFHGYLLLALICTVFLGGYIAIGHPFWSAGSLEQYYLMGISSLPTSASREIAILIICGTADIMLCRHMENGGGRFKYLVLFLLLYSQGALLYSLWGSTMTHYLTLSTIHVTTIVAFLKLEMDHAKISVNKREISLFFLFACSLILLIYGAGVYPVSQQQYEQDFRFHKNYEWDLDRAHFTSSMNPVLFEDSAKLIQKYSQEPAIHIISKYDAILPFLSKKYSAMPFFELSKYFTTPRELNASIEKVRQDRPTYLFADTDIARDYTIDVLDPRMLNVQHLQGFSFQRVKQLELLQQVFFAVQDDYELVEQGLLITVYRRK